MCGISGYISKRKLISGNALQKTTLLMKNRGPDNQGYFKKNYSDKEILLLHSRLNIIDLHDRSNQPFRFKNFILIFNGEIYNYLELRENLKKKNYFFETNSDTEVLIKMYLEYGENCVNHFIGMWSFALWDMKKKELFLSRDLFGEKPLYFFNCKDGFFFGSEIKYIKSLCKLTFDLNDLLIYKNLFKGYKSINKTTETFYKKIYSLESGQNIKINLNLNLRKKKYWQPQLKLNYNQNKRDIIVQTKILLENSLKLRMRSDVPVAFCLSGGVDSGLLASIAKKKLNKEISTFSIIDKDIKYNELDQIEIVINDLGCKSELINLKRNSENFLDRIKNLTKYHDGPIATASYYIHSLLTEKISKLGYRVSISGTGADEMFTGYYDHYLLHLQSIHNTKYFKKNLNSWKKHIQPVIRNPLLKNPMLYIKDPENRSVVYEENFNYLRFALKKKNLKFSEKYFSKEILRNRMFNEMFFEIVPIILKHDDMNSMFYSIENRSPYLDKDLYEFLLTVPPQYLISQGFQKKILRDSAKNILNDKIRLSRQKKGFNTSINSLINLKNENIKQIFFDKKSMINDFVDLEKFYNELDFKNIPNHTSKFIFSIITTKMFLDEF